MQYFDIIKALSRCVASSANPAAIHQLERLAKAAKDDGFLSESKSITAIIANHNRGQEMIPNRFERSRVNIPGEELSPQTPLPVDKESGTPLVEVLYPHNIAIDSPIFDDNVENAIVSIINEWAFFEKLSSVNAAPSSSCLIYGAPGTGKTHLALWIAKQMKLPVILTRLDGLMSSFLGTTSRNIGNLFTFAEKYKCILLLDEFDAIAKLRNDPQEVGEIKRVVNTLLQCLDSRKDRGFTIGITNHQSLLDPAIWRRFDVQIEIPKPAPDVMVKLIHRYMEPYDMPEFEVKFLSWSINNASGADAESLVKWLKKAYVLQDQKTSLVDYVRKFAILNSGRIEAERRNILISSNDSIANALASDLRYSFKQKDIALLIGKTPSSLSKMLSKK